MAAVMQEETSENRDKWKEALQNLYTTYDRLKEDNLMGKIERIETTQGE